jgi:hypothetical protein
VVVSRRLAALGRRGRIAATTFDEIAKLGVVESGLERRFVRIIQAGLPVPQLQRRYELPGVGTVRVDFEYPTHGIVVEVGGRRGYMSREERQDQERRRTALQLAGKTVYFFTRDDVFADPGHVVGTLVAALAAERATG